MTSTRAPRVLALAVVFFTAFTFVQAGPSGNNCGGGDGGSSVDSMQVFSCMTSQSSGGSISGVTGGVDVTLTAMPSTIASGQAVVLSWTSAGAESCNLFYAEMPDGQIQSLISYGPPNGSTTVYPARDTRYGTICSNSAMGVGGDDEIVTVTAAMPDLGVSAGATQAGTTLQGVITGTVDNGGGAGTGANFTTITDIDDDSVHSAVYASVSRTTTALDAGAQVSADINYTFPSYATWYYRTCTDTGAVIGESNESNNCTSWQSITLIPPALPDITASQVQMIQVSGTLTALLQSVISNVGNAPTNQ